jgi:glutamate dehydrogenase
LYKDASANKGGVTSSSLEVLASLSFDDEGFLKHMCVGEDGTVPEFYNNYVKQVQAIIQNNARLEFEAIWREHQATGERRSILSDTLSIAITKMDEELQSTDLWQNVDFRKSILSEALPNLLLEQIGLEKIMERVRQLHSVIGTSANQNRYLRTIYVPYLEAISRVDLYTRTASMQANLRSSIS